MPDPKRFKGKITVFASDEGIERAKSALIRLGFESISNFSKSSLVSRATVTKFFKQQPIQIDSFKEICQQLKLDDWQMIVQSSGAESSRGSQQPGSAFTRISAAALSESNTEFQANLMTSDPTRTRRVTILDPSTDQVKAVIVLEGSALSIDHQLKVVLQLALQEHTGSTVKITDIQLGSIRVSITGSQAAINRLMALIQSGQLTRLDDRPIQEIQVFQENLDHSASPEIAEVSADKWNLVKSVREASLQAGEIEADLSDVNLSGADFSGVDLSDANLSGADLRGADLRDADLRDADLTEANLTEADLRGADLRGADLRNARLSGADLSGAAFFANDLSGADLSGTNFRLSDLRFNAFRGTMITLRPLKKPAIDDSSSQSLEQDLIERGAIVERSASEPQGGRAKPE